MNSQPIDEILKNEITQIERSRKLRLGDDCKRPPAGESLIGLAFSGGGIRSATFNLGILQALAKTKMLRRFDYISTVSGGGYIGSWLMAWMHHQNIGIKKIEEHLSEQPDPRSGKVDRPEVRFLRSYSNYLTPRKGLLSADFWGFAAGYLRNTLLNQMILVLLLLSLLLIPRSIVTGLHFLEIAENSLQAHYFGPLKDYIYAQYLAAILGLFLGLVAVIFIGLNVVALDARNDDTYPRFTEQRWIQILIVAPLFLAAGLITYALGHFMGDYQILDHPYSLLPLLGMLLYAGPWALALIVRSVVLRKSKVAGVDGPSGWLLLGTAAVTGAVASYLFLPYSYILFTANPSENQWARISTNWHVMTFGTPALTLIMLLAGALHIGLMGRQLSDAHREWWARLGGWLGIYSVCWLFLFLIALYSPYVVARVLGYYHGQTLAVTGTLTWIGSTLYGILVGKSGATSGLLPGASVRKKLLIYLARLTPYIFILGLLIALSLLNTRIVHQLGRISGPVLSLPKDAAFFSLRVPAICILLLVVALVLSWRIDVNEFSIHYIYRNRLVRCYLGASAKEREEQPFTGFSNEDDVPLGALKIPPNEKDEIDDRPLPILNTTLNVVRGKELALQTRKARSFPFTPLCVGFTRPIQGTTKSESIFAPADTLGADRPNSKHGVRLGTAMAISGAAVSPNMGFYSAPDLSFLMTIFDVRLGWWIASPKGTSERWRVGSPYLGFYWLLCELLGATNDDSQYLYLSDGGHFENLAIYELVRRRCKLVVVCDVSCDAGYGCADLHNAMERCRADFGVDIDIGADELGKIMPSGAPPRAVAHHAVGRIHYNTGSLDDDGVLIYLKPALQASDPADLLGYQRANPAFPHDSTADQWFDELHFENYRALGEVSGLAVLGEIEAQIDSLLNRPKSK